MRIRMQWNMKWRKATNKSMNSNGVFGSFLTGIFSFIFSFHFVQTTQTQPQPPGLGAIGIDCKAGPLSV